MKKIIQRIEKLEQDVAEIKSGLFKPSNIVCDNCGWKWLTKTKARRVSCPGCGSKVTVKQ